MTRDNILGWIKEVQPGRDDVVFVYFSGHGGAAKTETKDMYIFLDGSTKLYRKEIVKAMESIECRLKILVTDACSAGPLVDKPDVVVSPDIDLDTALHNLFFEHEGFLNISSASEGEKAVGDNTQGSYFTASLVDSIIVGVESKKLDSNPLDGFVSWEEVFELAKEITQERFDVGFPLLPKLKRDEMEKAGQTTQTPKYFGELPKRFER